MKNLLYIAVLTTAIVVSWIVFGIYHNSITSTIQPDTNVIITPIPGNFDLETIEKIRARQIVRADLSENSAVASAAPVIKRPTPTISSPTPFVSSPSASL